MSNIGNPYGDLEEHEIIRNKGLKEWKETKEVKFYKDRLPVDTLNYIICTILLLCRWKQSL
jgi:hypothetical protein